MSPLVRWFGGAAEAAGCEEERIDAAHLAQVWEVAEQRHGSALRQVIAQCAVLVDGTRTDDPGAPLEASQTVDVLPPFAGG